MYLSVKKKIDINLLKFLTIKVTRRADVARLDPVSPSRHQALPEPPGHAHTPRRLADKYR